MEMESTDTAAGCDIDIDIVFITQLRLILFEKGGEDVILNNCWRIETSDPYSVAIYLRTFVVFTKELSIKDLQSFVNLHCWTIFDKLIESTSAVMNFDIALNLSTMSRLLACGYCSYREVMLMAVSKLEDQLDLPCLAIILPLLENAMMFLPLQELETGLKMVREAVKNLRCSGSFIGREYHQTVHTNTPPSETYALFVNTESCNGAGEGAQMDEWGLEMEVAIKNCMLMLKRLASATKQPESYSHSSFRARCECENWTMIVEDLVVEAYLSFVVVICERCPSIDDRDLLFTLILKDILTVTTVAVDYLFSHDMRVRHLLLYAATKVANPALIRHENEIDSRWDLLADSFPDVLGTRNVSTTGGGLDDVVPWHILSDEARQQALQSCSSLFNGDKDDSVEGILARKLRIQRSASVFNWSLSGIACLKYASLKLSTKSLPQVYSTQYIWNVWFPSCYQLLRVLKTEGLYVWNRLVAVATPGGLTPYFSFAPTLLSFCWNCTTGAGYDSMGFSSIINKELYRPQRKNYIEKFVQISLSQDTYALSQLVVNAMVVIAAADYLKLSCNTLRRFLAEFMV